MDTHTLTFDRTGTAARCSCGALFVPVKREQAKELHRLHLLSPADAKDEYNRLQAEAEAMPQEQYEGPAGDWLMVKQQQLAQQMDEE